MSQPHLLHLAALHATHATPATICRVSTSHINRCVACSVPPCLPSRLQPSHPCPAVCSSTHPRPTYPALPVGSKDPKTLTGLVSALNLSQERVNADLMTYKGVLSRLEGAKEIMKVGGWVGGWVVMGTGGGGGGLLL